MPRKKPAKARRGIQDVSPDWPVWYTPLSPLGSAVRYLAGMSPRFNWVGIYRLVGKTLVLGPFVGEETEHRRIPVGKGVCGTAVALGKDMNVPDVAATDNYLACSLLTRSELVVLIREPGGRIVGQIDIDSHTADAFGPDEERAVKQVADELGQRWPTSFRADRTT